MLEGLTLVPEFLSESEERDLLASLPKKAVLSGQRNRDSIARWGVENHYNGGFRGKQPPTPLQMAAARIKEQGLMDAVPRSFTMNQYYAGQSLKAHVDALQCGPKIVVLSLLGRAILRFTNPNDAKARPVDVALTPRSLLVMSGPAREIWMHEVLPLKEERYSIVFRR